MARVAGFAVAAFSLLTAGEGGALAQTADAIKQFNIKHNPNGQWSYLAGGQLLTHTIACDGAAKFGCWWNGGSIPNSAVIGGNKTGTTQSFYTIVLPKGYLNLDPESLSDTTVQWTAPAAGSVLVKGNFLGVDTNEASHSVAVLHNGTPLKTYVVASYNQKFKFKLGVTVAAGDTIGFASYTNGAYYLSTGLQATITPQ